MPPFVGMLHRADETCQGGSCSVRICAVTAIRPPVVRARRQRAACYKIWKARGRRASRRHPRPPDKVVAQAQRQK
jgi:hypothetical protein